MSRGRGRGRGRGSASADGRQKLVTAAMQTPSGHVTGVNVFQRFIESPIFETGIRNAYMSDSDDNDEDNSDDDDDDDDEDEDEDEDDGDDDGDDGDDDSDDDDNNDVADDDEESFSTDASDTSCCWYFVITAAVTLLFCGICTNVMIMVNIINNERVRGRCCLFVMNKL
uniref:Uncharacterized protein n=1 Tax=Glossina austeni TaxID=7395 RepID=A0A1A9UPU3_GLOAU